MEESKKSQVNKQESLYVSARLFAFMLNNTRRVKPLINLEQFDAIYGKFSAKDVENDIKIDIQTLIEYFETCLNNKFLYDDFYDIGNKIHELHFAFVTMLVKLNAQFSNTLKNEISFLNLGFGFNNDVLELNVTIDNLLVLDTRQICVPILKIAHGFVDRLFLIYLNNKPTVIQKEGSLEFSYQPSFISDFDLARFITNEQFFFSRMKNYMNEVTEESVIKNVEFYLFRDISFSIEEIADRMDISVRALQRKLKEEKSSFRQIKEAIRKALSEKYLMDEELSIQQVCELLAYSERSAFEKAFKKWFGKSPIMFRKSLG